MALIVYNGYKIDVDDAGTFSVKLADDLELEDKTLQGLRDKIDRAAASAAKKKTLALPVVCVIRPAYHQRENKEPKVVRAKVTGVNRTSRKLELDPKEKGWEPDDVLPASDENEALLLDYLRLQKELDAVQERIGARTLKVDGYGRIDPGTYEKILDQLAARHAQILKEKGAKR